MVGIVVVAVVGRGRGGGVREGGGDRLVGEGGGGGKGS